jgi:hypothetical protein
MHKWNHKDVIRLAHVKPKNNPIGFVIRYIIKNMEEAASITEYDRSDKVAEVKS